MNDVKAERRLYHIARLPHSKRERGIFEALDHLAAAETTQVTPCLGGAAIGVRTREGAELGTVSKLLRNVGDLRLSFFFASGCGGAVGARIHEKDV